MSRDEPITFATVTKPNLDRLKVLMPKVLPFVDRAVVIVGERNVETETYLKSLGPKVEIYYYKWHDDFAASWNAYLSRISEGWVLILDDDEVPSDDMLNSLDRYVNDSNYGDNICCVGFRCNPISEGQDMGPCDYYRQVFFRYNSGMKYASAHSSGCHQCLVGYQNNKIIHSKPTEVYYHIKSLKEEYRNASRNYFIYGLWISDQQIDQREEWHELKRVIAQNYPGAFSFPDLNRELEAGNLRPELIEWMKKWHVNLSENSGYFKANPGFEYWHYNEARALIKYVFEFLHPELKPEEIVF
jgi:glycosyltransferase involved in cell wall biosynthesis